MIQTKLANGFNSIGNEYDITKTDFLTEHGFQSIGNVGELIKNGIPTKSNLLSCGVYSISIPKNYLPQFIIPADALANGNVLSPWSIERLKSKWVENADIIYFGLAGAKSNRSLKKRINDLIKHANGATSDRGPHKGGEIIWQLNGFEEFKVWIYPTGLPPEPRIIEEKLIRRFFNQTSKLPFGNRQF
ncbi:MAG: hypothetical protein C4543_00640 [Ignavibacteriales bacterium]|nr:MAG: hypothetical protein C4543_00640 [Ignavibacteriales bacterium]